jgi:hypothetical protein
MDSISYVYRYEIEFIFLNHAVYRFCDMHVLNCASRWLIHKPTRGALSTVHDFQSVVVTGGTFVHE